MNQLRAKSTSPSPNAKNPKPGEERTGTGQGPPQVVEEPSAMVNTEGTELEDIVIAVMGPTGVGKTTFIGSASGRGTRSIDHASKSLASQVLAVRFWDHTTGRHVVLVDTPGFDNTFDLDFNVLSTVSQWLSSSYNEDKVLSGILYLHRITDNRMAGTPLRNLRVFRNLCRNDTLEKVYFTTTMWDEVDSEIGERRLDELSRDYWKTMIDQGARVARCRIGDNSPKELIRRIICQEGVRNAPPHEGGMVVQ